MIGDPCVEVTWLWISKDILEARSQLCGSSCGGIPVDVAGLRISKNILELGHSRDKSSCAGIPRGATIR